MKVICKFNKGKYLSIDDKEYQINNEYFRELYKRNRIKEIIYKI